MVLTQFRRVCDKLKSSLFFLPLILPPDILFTVARPFTLYREFFNNARIYFYSCTHSVFFCESCN